MFVEIIEQSFRIRVHRQCLDKWSVDFVATIKLLALLKQHKMDAEDELLCCVCVSRSHLSGRFHPLPEWGGEQHYPPWEAGPEWRHDLPPLSLFHQLLTQYVSHRYTRTHWGCKGMYILSFPCRVFHLHNIIGLGFTPDWLHYSSSILLHMNASAAHLEMQLRLHVILAVIAHRSVSEMCWSAQDTPSPTPSPHPYIPASGLIWSSHAMGPKSLIFMR